MLNRLLPCGFAFQVNYIKIVIQHVSSANPHGTDRFQASTLLDKNALKSSPAMRIRVSSKLYGNNQFQMLIRRARTDFRAPPRSTKALLNRRLPCRFAFLVSYTTILIQHVSNTNPQGTDRFKGAPQELPRASPEPPGAPRSCSGAPRHFPELP